MNAEPEGVKISAARCAPCGGAHPSGAVTPPRGSQKPKIFRSKVSEYHPENTSEKLFFLVGAKNFFFQKFRFF